MKKFITILFVTVIIANICNAQISKGSMLIGGDLGVNSISSTYVSSPKDHSNGFYFSPSFATAIKTNFISWRVRRGK